MMRELSATETSSSEIPRAPSAIRYSAVAAIGCGERVVGVNASAAATLKVLFLSALLLSPAIGEPQVRDTAGVRAAANDYLDGFYQGDSTLHVRSIHLSVYKYGFSRQQNGAYRGMQMQWPQFHAFANRVKAGQVKTPPNAPHIVQVMDIADQTAAAKVTAWWGIDYLLMAKVDGRWQIYHVMWQSPPLP